MIALEKAGILDLLFQVYPEVVVTPHFEAEVGWTYPRAARYALANAGIGRLMSTKIEKGEASVIVAAT